MKKLIILILGFLLLQGVWSAFTKEDLEREVNEGKEIYEKLKKKEISCADLTKENFASLGEYFMDLMVGNRDSHLAMNLMMKNMHGEDGEELMHINMGKRFSGCDTSTNFSLPMMGDQFDRMPMMNFFYWSGWKFLGPVFVFLGIIWFLVILSMPILVLVLLIVTILYLIKKLKRQD